MAIDIREGSVPDIIGGSALRLEQIIIGVEATRFMIDDSVAWLEVEASIEQMRKALSNLDQATLHMKMKDKINNG